MAASRKPRFFTRAAKATSRLAGKPLTFAVVVLMVLAWAVSGPFFDYSDSWQLTINTATTIVTFLMVFLIQATQNRDAEAMQIKLDEIIRCQNGAHNALLDLEELEDEELMKFRALYLALAEQARQRVDQGLPDTDVPELEGARKKEGGGERGPRKSR